MNPGEYLLLPHKEAPHNIRSGYRPSLCSFYWMHFLSPEPLCMQQLDDEEFSHCQAALLDDRILIPVHGVLPKPETIIVLMKQLQDSVRSSFPSTVLNYGTTTILCSLNAQLQKAANIKSPANPKNDQRQIYADIIDYVKLNTHVPLKVTDIAGHFGYNEKYLSHLFNEIAGIPLKQFILTNKMETANLKLADSNDSITDIALSLGFTDGHNFSKAYKKIVGLTPTEYRNSFAKRILVHE